MLPRKNIDEPNVNNRVSSYPKVTLKAPLSYPLGTLTHAYASMLAYAYIRKLGTEGYTSSNEESQGTLRGAHARVCLKVPPYKFIIKF